LVDIDALNFVHVHLDRMASDETPFEDNAAVGHVYLRRPPSEPGGER
jgi:hypothetical protein